MADYGMITYDESGNMLTNISTRLPRHLGTVNVTNSGNLTDDGLLTGDWWAVLLSKTTGVSPILGNCTLNVSGDTLSWTVSAGTVDFILIYGVY